jgi:hypothetical protein
VKLRYTVLSQLLVREKSEQHTHVLQVARREISVFIPHQHPELVEDVVNVRRVRVVRTPERVAPDAAQRVGLE